MKSVVAEASSISKAVELAWQKAGQPKEFLVKVFQEPQRNMFGLTKTSAKVGIFFGDAALTQKIKNATQNTIPSSQNNKTVNPISPIKPIASRPQTPKQAAPKLNKPQPKLESDLSSLVVETTTPSNQPELIAKPNQENKPVSKNRSEVKQPNQRRNTQSSRPAQNQSKTQVANQLNQTNLSTPELKNSDVLLENNLPVNANVVSSDIAQTTPRPARNKYYRRRRPKSNRPNNSENNEQARPAAAAPINKSED